MLLQLVEMVDACNPGTGTGTGTADGAGAAWRSSEPWAALIPHRLQRKALLKNAVDADDCRLQDKVNLLWMIL